MLRPASSRGLQRPGAHADLPETRTWRPRGPRTPLRGGRGVPSLKGKRVPLSSWAATAEVTRAHWQGPPRLSSAPRRAGDVRPESRRTAFGPELATGP